jgi:hypothetical protein
VHWHAWAALTGALILAAYAIWLALPLTMRWDRTAKDRAGSVTTDAALPLIANPTAVGGGEQLIAKARVAADEAGPAGLHVEEAN